MSHSHNIVGNNRKDLYNKSNKHKNVLIGKWHTDVTYFFLNRKILKSSFTDIDFVLENICNTNKNDKAIQYLNEIKSREARPSKKKKMLFNMKFLILPQV